MKKPIVLLLLLFCINIFSYTQNLCYIDPELQQLINQKSDDLISVNIILKSQIDVNKLSSRTQRFSDRDAKNDAVLKEFKKFSEASQSDVLSVLQAETRSNKVRDINCHWITNMINCELAGDVVYQLAQHPDIIAITYNKLEYMLFNEEAKEVEATRGMTENIKKINADVAWNWGYTGEGVLVSILDTGVNINHVDLKDHLWDGGEEYPNHGYNTLNKTHDVNDVFGHGTHCAGTICGDGTSGTQTGIAPNATLMVIKVLGDDGLGSVDAIISGVEFSIENDADLLSLSLGASFSNTYTDGIYRSCFTHLLEFDILAVVAAGNDRTKMDEYPVPRNINAPANCPPAWIHPDQQSNMGGTSSVISVGAVDDYDAHAYFSSEGPVTWSGTQWNDYVLDMSSELDHGWLDYDNNEFVAGISVNPSFKWGVMFPPSKLKKFENGELTKVAMYDCVAHSGNSEIYQGGDTPNAGILVLSQPFACSGSNSFVEFDLTTPLAIDNTENLWIILSTDDGGINPAAACNTIHDPNGRWVGTTYNDYTTWSDICDDYGHLYTWMIRAFVDDNSGVVAALGADDSEFGLIRPDVCAPGYGIVSASHTSNDGHISLNGTSMAAPCVAGAVALLLEKNPYITPAQICEGLETKAVKLTEKKSNMTGSGRIDIAATMDLFEEDGEPIISLQEVTPTEIVVNKSTPLQITLENTGTAPTHDIILKLLSDDPNVTIINTAAQYGVIAPGRTVTKTFKVKAKADTPEGHIINFTLKDGDWTETFSVTVTNSDNIADLSSAFNIYPNPVENQLTIESDVKIETINIYDTYGRLMSTNDGQQTTVNVSDLNSGVYFVRIMTDNGEVSKLFIKK